MSPTIIPNLGAELDKAQEIRVAKGNLQAFLTRERRAQIANALFLQVEHGDETHRAWLKDELLKFFRVDQA